MRGGAGRGAGGLSEAIRYFDAEGSMVSENAEDIIFVLLLFAVFNLGVCGKATLAVAIASAQALS